MEQKDLNFPLIFYIFTLNCRNILRNRITLEMLKLRVKWTVALKLKSDKIDQKRIILLFFKFNIVVLCNFAYYFVWVQPLHILVENYNYWLKFVILSKLIPSWTRTQVISTLRENSGVSLLGVRKWGITCKSADTPYWQLIC